jgi:hypothetical protein
MNIKLTGNLPQFYLERNYEWQERDKRKDSERRTQVKIKRIQGKLLTAERKGNLDIRRARVREEP